MKKKKKVVSKYPKINFFFFSTKNVHIFLISFIKHLGLILIRSTCPILLLSRATQSYPLSSGISYVPTYSDRTEQTYH